MTSKAVPITRPVELTDTAAEQVQGGAPAVQERLVSSVKDNRPTPTDTGFIPSAGSSRMD